MRHAGTLSNRTDAGKLSAYLATQGIETRVDADADGASLWVIDEDRLPDVRQALVDFSARPDDPKYDGVEEAARKAREEAARRHAETRKNIVDVRKRWERPNAGSAPFTYSLIGICLVVAGLEFLPDKAEAIGQLLSIAPYSVDEDWLSPPGLENVRNGEVWRLITPIFLHFKIMGLPLLHLLFNMFWLSDFGGAIELRRGSLRLAGMVPVIAVASNLAQYYVSGPNFGGMSGVVYGLFGYIWMKSKFDPRAGLSMPDYIRNLMLAWFVVCILVMENVANTAHAVGLIAGMGLGFAPSLWRRKK